MTRRDLLSTLNQDGRGEWGDHSDLGEEGRKHQYPLIPRCAIKIVLAEVTAMTPEERERQFERK